RSRVARALAAGVLEAPGGGGWAPVGPPALLASGRLEPRKVLGSIATSAFIVALAASLGFLVGLGSAGVNPGWAVALLVGGVAAAPVAAWIVRVFPPRVLGSAVGGLILLTNTRTILTSDWVTVSDPVRTAVYALVWLLWAAAVAWSVRAHLADRRASAVD